MCANAINGFRKKIGMTQLKLDRGLCSFGV
jgi:hypothetical protein